MPDERVLIIGAGPAGMGCAYTLAKAERPCYIAERDDNVGGLCATLSFGGYLFDIGGHRFLSKSEKINDLWRQVMGDDMLHGKRMSRIYYRKRYFNYPLSFLNTFWNLGPIESLLSIISYIRCKLLKPCDDNTFEGWIINRFGRRLYDIFFKIYTEKIWAVPCKDISADWAQQRIQGLSLRVAIQNTVFHSKKNKPKTLSSEFLYPRTGPGEFYRRLGQFISKNAGEFAFGKAVRRVNHNGNRIISIELDDLCSDVKRRTLPVEYLFSSMPLPVLIKSMNPKPPEDILRCAEKMRFRSLLVINILLDKEHIFPDQWIYVHSPEVRLGRIQNYKNWSPAMVLDMKKTSLGLEYFCTEGDDLWAMNDVDLINYALEELEMIGITSRKHLINGFVVRRPDVYPIYFLDYQKEITAVRDYLNNFVNLQTIGRAGLFRYDNSDHALLTGIYAAKNYLGEQEFDIWKINTEKEYLEA